MARRKFTAAFKAEIALKALRNDATISELASKHEIHPNMITKWRSELLKQASTVFQQKNGTRIKDHTAYLERKIGQLTIENDFLKKNWNKYRGENE